MPRDDEWEWVDEEMERRWKNCIETHTGKDTNRQVITRKGVSSPQGRDAQEGNGPARAGKRSGNIPMNKRLRVWGPAETRDRSCVSKHEDPQGPRETVLLTPSTAVYSHFIEMHSHSPEVYK